MTSLRTFNNFKFFYTIFQLIYFIKMTNIKTLSIFTLNNIISLQWF